MIDTPRLVLRRPVETDAGAMYAYRILPDVSRYQCWEPASADEVRAFLRGLPAAAPAPAGKWFQFGIYEREGGTMVGDLMDRLFEGDVTALVSHLLSEQEIDPEELDASCGGDTGELVVRAYLYDKAAKKLVPAKK